jgi:hypothetical protein
MKVRQMYADLIRWMGSFLSERMVEIVFQGNSMERHPGEAGVPQGSPLWLILWGIYTSGLIKWVEEYASAKGLYSGNDLSWVATGSGINQ